MTEAASGAGPFSGALWDQARQNLDALGHAPAAADRNEALARLAIAAADDGQISDDERALLQVLSDRGNVRQISQALQHAPFGSVSALQFPVNEAANAAADRLLNAALTAHNRPQTAAAAADVRAGYAPQLLEQASRGERLTVPDALRPSPEAMQAPRDIRSAEGREALLSNYTQLNGQLSADHACVAACVVAAAVNRGPEALTRVIRSLGFSDPTVINRMVQHVQAGTFSLQDAAQLQDRVYSALATSEFPDDMSTLINSGIAAGNAAGGPDVAGFRAVAAALNNIQNQTVTTFLQNNGLTDLFGPDCQMVAIDNDGVVMIDSRDGQNHGDHATLQFTGSDGQPRRFDPMLRAPATDTAQGQQVIRDAATLDAYSRATTLPIVPAH